MDSPDVDWSVDEEDIAYFSTLLDNHIDNLPYSFLQSPLPEGQGFSSNCAEWLDLLNAKSWDEFVYHSTKCTVYHMMSTLTVPVYFRYCKDLRHYLVFGNLCKVVYPSSQSYKVWMNQFRVLLSSYWLNQKKLVTIFYLLKILQPTNQSFISNHMLRNPPPPFSSQ